MTWTKSVIRDARKAELAPLLIGCGYRLQSLRNGNYGILPDPDDPAVPVGLIVKQNFWTWTEKNISGNAIDFFVQIEGKTFNQAMEIITRNNGYDAPERNLREERGNVPKILR